MASQELQDGSGADSMAWSESPGISTLDSSNSTPIEDERLFKLVERRSRKRRAKIADAASPGHSTQQNAAQALQRLTASPRVSLDKCGNQSRFRGFTLHHPEAPGNRRSQGCIPTWRAGSSVRGLPGHSGRRIAQLAPHMGAKPHCCRHPHVADKLLRDFQLDSSKGRLPMHGHLKLTGDVCRDVINVANHETKSKLASAPNPQNSDAMESDAEPSPALVATITAIEECLTSKMKSMIETTMDQILTKVMTTVPAGF
ncbi:hypothetical protein HPB50_018593 [Hyalomma asiaticum]|uniref:Uncharacterized protein n=1 Tax=Hyalomma asiaticum TaxID=266040 RepID=A0ACB7SG41_HYAAI|nr:hypothetical protein HPB50_018593 [Hyalomma asiaticum]